MFLILAFPGHSLAEPLVTIFCSGALESPVNKKYYLRLAVLEQIWGESGQALNQYWVLIPNNI
jgi:hypothetical protein